MPDDFDDQLRSAMKTLDDQVPSGYFEALPNQILARLEDGSMQHGTGTTERDKRDALTGPPVAAQAPQAPATAKKPERDEDSGLHDIRNLAQSTKQRLSSRRSTQNPPIADDVLASSSGSWKNIALPQPAKMVSLPELAELPSKQEIAAAERAAEKRLAEETKQKARAKKGDKTAPPPMASDEVLAPIATANAALDAMSAKPAIEPRQAFTLPSQQNKGSKKPLLVVMGLGIAAAAGGVIFMQMNKDDKASTAPAAVASADMAQGSAAPEAAPAPPPAETAPVAAEVAAVAATEETAEAAGAEEADDAADADTKASGKRSKRAAKGKKAVDNDAAPAKTEVKVEDKKPEPEKTEPKKPGAKDDGEPSFDALLKEAGVEEKKEVKPKLDKKSLSGDDFKKGMAGIASRAQGCYTGNQGTAMVKLTVAPSGKVTKAAVTGQFAGKPEGACVQAAVKSATFPPWDGGPQTFSYSYMLAD